MAGKKAETVERPGYHNGRHFIDVCIANDQACPSFQRPGRKQPLGSRRRPSRSLTVQALDKITKPGPQASSARPGSTRSIRYSTAICSRRSTECDGFWGSSAPPVYRPERPDRRSSVGLVGRFFGWALLFGFFGLVLRRRESWAGFCSGWSVSSVPCRGHPPLLAGSPWFGRTTSRSWRSGQGSSPILSAVRRASVRTPSFGVTPHSPFCSSVVSMPEAVDVLSAGAAVAGGGQLQRGSCRRPTRSRSARCPLPQVRSPMITARL